MEYIWICEKLPKFSLFFSNFITDQHKSVGGSHFLWEFGETPSKNNPLLQKVSKNVLLTQPWYPPISSPNLILLSCIYWKFHNDNPWSHSKKFSLFLCLLDLLFMRIKVGWEYILFMYGLPWQYVLKREPYYCTTLENLFSFPHHSCLPLPSQARGKERAGGDGLREVPWARLWVWAHFLKTISRVTSSSI